MHFSKKSNKYRILFFLQTQTFNLHITFSSEAHYISQMFHLSSHRHEIASKFFFFLFTLQNETFICRKKKYFQCLHNVSYIFMLTNSWSRTLNHSRAIFTMKINKRAEILFSRNEMKCEFETWNCESNFMFDVILLGKRTHRHIYRCCTEQKTNDVAIGQVITQISIKRQLDHGRDHVNSPIVCNNFSVTIWHIGNG